MSLAPFVVSLNLHRRHLNESQRAMVASRIANLGHGQRADRAANLPVLQSDASDMLNVSERSTRSAQKVSESPVPELSEAVDAGRVAVSTAATLAEAPEDELRRVISTDGEKTINRAAVDAGIRKRRISVRTDNAVSLVTSCGV